MAAAEGEPEREDGGAREFIVQLLKELLDIGLLLETSRSRALAHGSCLS